MVENRETSVEDGFASCNGASCSIFDSVNTSLWCSLIFAESFHEQGALTFVQLKLISSYTILRMQLRFPSVYMCCFSVVKDYI